MFLDICAFFNINIYGWLSSLNDLSADGYCYKWCSESYDGVKPLCLRGYLHYLASEGVRYSKAALYCKGCHQLFVNNADESKRAMHSEVSCLPETMAHELTLYCTATARWACYTLVIRAIYTVYDDSLVECLFITVLLPLLWRCATRQKPEPIEHGPLL